MVMPNAIGIPRLLLSFDFLKVVAADFLVGLLSFSDFICCLGSLRYYVRNRFHT